MKIALLIYKKNNSKYNKEINVDNKINNVKIEEGINNKKSKVKSKRSL